MSGEIEQTVTIDGTAYAVSKLSQTARYCLQNIQDLQNQQAQAKARVDQCEMAVQGFLNTLRQDIAANYDKEEGDE
jgi:hypothetical protein